MALYLLWRGSSKSKSSLSLRFFSCKLWSLFVRAFNIASSLVASTSLASDMRQGLGISFGTHVGSRFANLTVNSNRMRTANHGSLQFDECLFLNGIAQIDTNRLSDECAWVQRRCFAIHHLNAWLRENSKFPFSLLFLQSILLFGFLEFCWQSSLLWKTLKFLLQKHILLSLRVTPQKPCLCIYNLQLNNGQSNVKDVWQENAQRQLSHCKSWTLLEAAKKSWYHVITLVLYHRSFHCLSPCLLPLPSHFLRLFSVSLFPQLLS